MSKEMLKNTEYKNFIVEIKKQIQNSQMKKGVFILVCNYATSCGTI